MAEVTIWTVADLIRKEGKKLTDQCSLCEAWDLYEVRGFKACWNCDTTSESRKEAENL